MARSRRFFTLDYFNRFKSFFGHLPLHSESLKLRSKSKLGHHRIQIGTLVKCNTDPPCLPPNDVTVVIAVLDVDNKIE
jgi:hypothetical protein